MRRARRVPKLRNEKATKAPDNRISTHFNGALFKIVQARHQKAFAGKVGEGAQGRGKFTAGGNDPQNRGVLNKQPRIS